MNHSHYSNTNKKSDQQENQNNKRKVAPATIRSCQGNKLNHDDSKCKSQETVDDKHIYTNCLYHTILKKKTKHAHGIGMITRRDKKKNDSRFQSCPICLKTFPIHAIERHASLCTTGPTNDDASYQDPISSNCVVVPYSSNKYDHTVIKTDRETTSCTVQTSLVDEVSIEDVHVIQKWKDILKHDKQQSNTNHKSSSQRLSNNEPLPGLFIFEDFITPQEEEEIISMLDGKGSHADSFLTWKASKFNGKHAGKRWGVHCSLKDRKVYPQDTPLPPLLLNLINAKIRQLQEMKGCIPNEANAIDYRQKNGDYLKNHVDDRQLSKEPIANLSLAGDCFMTFRLERHSAPDHFPKVQKVLIKRRTLQVLTSNARYDYSHGIDNEDLLDERRISITMRESPLRM
mmetsp:Transcript_13162/g.24735  ORF Transcript_13162/g.24735 Transcript_13162/m.24735 type:complete len:400 (-) Transcript_13162:1528-2727(-)